MTVQGKHRILLVNFSERDAGGLTKAGFNVELGYVGMLEKRGQKDLLPYYFPHPARRPRLYAGDSEEIVQAAKDQDIGLLSTVELYKIAIAVKNGVMSKEEAKSLIKQTGRIEYGAQDQDPLQA